MTDSEEAVREIVAGDPEVRSALSELLELDSRHTPWDREDAPVGPDEFSYLLSNSVVESQGEGYRLADPNSVRAVLREDSGTATEKPFVQHFQQADRRLLLAVAGVLALLVLVRVLPLAEVYRNGDIVLSGNDPYRVRYYVTQLAVQAGSPLDVGPITDTAEGMPTSRALLLASMWWVSELLGGGPTAVGTVLAWYPVLSALATGGLVYLLALRVSGDPRIGVAAVGFLAVAPGHAFRTGVGFADHHAFDYFWLVLTVFVLVVLVTADPRTRRAWAYAGALGVAVAGQTLAWEASPILHLPLGVALSVYALLAVRADVRAVLRLLPITAGLALGAVLTYLAHVALGWQIVPVVYVPGLLFLGGVSLLGASVGVQRLGRSAPTLAGVQLLGGASVLGLLFVLFSDASVGFVQYVNRGVGYFQRLQTSSIGETTSVVSGFGGESSLLIGPFVMLGFAVFLGVPVALWSFWRAYERNEAGWPILGVYVLYLLGWSLVQRRFTGELAPLLAVLAGFGFVYLTAWLQLTRMPRPLGETGERNSASTLDPEPTLESPDRRSLLMLGSIVFIFWSTPAAITRIIHSMVTIDPHKYQAARWMREYAEERGWADAESYVFSEWGRNTMYNYFVSGNSRSYWYAKENYGEFILSSDPEEWYEELRGRTGFIVVNRLPSDLSQLRMYKRLFEQYGSRALNVDGLAHYRAVYASPDESLKVFTPVPGATLTGTGPESVLLTVSTTVSIEGAEFEYERRPKTDTDGSLAVTVPYPGEYTVGDTTVSVPEAAVVNGEDVDVGGRIEVRDD